MERIGYFQSQFPPFYIKGIRACLFFKRRILPQNLVATGAVFCFVNFLSRDGQFLCSPKSPGSRLPAAFSLFLFFRFRFLPYLVVFNNSQLFSCPLFLICLFCLLLGSRAWDLLPWGVTAGWTGTVLWGLILSITRISQIIEQFLCQVQ